MCALRDSEDHKGECRENLELDRMFYMLTTDGYVTIKTELNILSKNFTTCKLYLNKQEHKKNHAQ